MIDSAYFWLLWFIGTMYMFQSGGWQEFGEEHPFIAMLIVFLGAPIILFFISY